MHGKGVVTFPNGTRLFCTFDHGQIVGEGEKYYAEGGMYKGELSQNCLPHGKGIWELPDGSRYEGEHDMGYRHGKGVLILPDGTRQVGLFEKDNYIGPDADSSEDSVSSSNTVSLVIKSSGIEFIFSKE